MCDYSLHSVTSRSAKVGDRLVTTSFQGTVTRGFADAAESVSEGNATEAVCCLSGTEMAFDAPARYRRMHRGYAGWVTEDVTSEFQVARFCQINPEAPYQHHDAVEFPDGSRVLLHDLATGQMVTVLQLPAKELPAKAEEATETAPEAQPETV